MVAIVINRAVGLNDHFQRLDVLCRVAGKGASE